MQILYLDKDGTLTQTKSGNKFVQSPWDQETIKGVPETLAKWVNDGWTPIIISNQQGVQYRHKSLEECFLEMRFALELFPAIKEAYFCPDDGATCWRCWGDCKESSRIFYGPDNYYVKFSGTYQKPGAGMIALASNIHCAVDAYMVGDMKCDEDAAKQANIKFSYRYSWGHWSDQVN